MEQINYADYVEILQSMSLEEIRAVLEVLQKSTDSYIYIMDLDTDTYMITSKMLTRFPFDDVVIKNATPALQKIIYPSDYPKVKEDIRKCAAGEQETHSLEYRWLDGKGPYHRISQCKNDFRG